MICDLCGQEGAHLVYITEAHGKGRDLLVIEDIPMVSCPHCGESYFTADTLHEIEWLKQYRQQRAVVQPVAVMQFA